MINFRCYFYSKALTSAAAICELTVYHSDKGFDQISNLLTITFFVCLIALIFPLTSAIIVSFSSC